MGMMSDQETASALFDEVNNLRAENARLREGLSEIHRRTALLITQNTGRWSGKVEHDRRTMSVLDVNQQIAEEALGTTSLSAKRSFSRHQERAMDWQPIETAPKDGTVCLVGKHEWGPNGALVMWKHNRRIDKSYWGDPEEYDDYSWLDNQPTHWLPLTAPPSVKTDAPAVSE